MSTPQQQNIDGPQKEQRSYFGVKVADKAAAKGTTIDDYVDNLESRFPRKALKAQAPGNPDAAKEKQKAFEMD